MLGSLATLGYAAKAKGISVQWELESAMHANPHALVVDTRFSPVCSWTPVWSRAHLERTYGARYVWRGDVLGNANYARADLPIRLVDVARGLPWIIDHLESGTTCILLCACALYTRCHRKVIYDLVQARMGNRLYAYEAGQHVMTPDGPGVIVSDVPLYVQCMRNRYSIQLDGSGRCVLHFPSDVTMYPNTKEQTLCKPQLQPNRNPSGMKSPSPATLAKTLK